MKVFILPVLCLSILAPARVSADPIFPAPRSADPALHHALCLAASLPVENSGGGSRGVGVLAPKGNPADHYAWVWIDTQEDRAAVLDVYKMPGNSWPVLDFASICTQSTPKMNAHTVITFVVEDMTTRGDKKRTYIVTAGTAAATKSSTMTGTREAAHKLAAKMAREVTGEMLVPSGPVDSRWSEPFGVSRP